MARTYISPSSRMITQGYFVYNLAHANTTIRSDSGGTLRILGAFATLEEAQALVAKQAATWPDLETRVSPLHTWRLLSKDLLDVEQQTEKFLNLLDAYSAHRARVFEDVAKRSTTQEMATENVSQSEKVESDEKCSQVLRANHDMNNGLPAVPREFELRLQKYVGIAIMPDIESEDTHKDLKDHEPAFQILCVAETESEIESFFQQWSEKYLMGDRHGLFSSVPLACVSMQETFRPAWAFQVSTRRIARDERLAQIREAFQRSDE